MLPAEVDDMDEAVAPEDLSMATERPSPASKRRGRKSAAKPKAPQRILAAGKDDDLDPVKMYLKKIGTVALLTREGEVEIAKRIEAGREEVLRTICLHAPGVQAVLNVG